MNHMGATDIVLVIGAIFTGICSVIAAIKSNSSDRTSKQVQATANSNVDKLDTIHSLTNGNLTKVKADLDLATKKNEYLNKVIMEMVDALPAGSLDIIKQKVDDKEVQLALRRKEDI